MCVHNASKCEIDNDSDATIGSANISPLFSKDNVQPTTA